MVDMWVQNVISELGSKEKLEEYSIRSSLRSARSALFRLAMKLS